MLMAAMGSAAGLHFGLVCALGRAEQAMRCLAPSAGPYVCRSSDQMNHTVQLGDHLIPLL